MEPGHHVKGSEVFIGGLSRSVTEDMIKEMFSPYGEILELRMMKDHSGISKGFCFVRFSTREAALKAQKEKNGFVLNGKQIGVEPSSDQDRLFFGNLRKDWSFEEFEKIVLKAFQDVVYVDLAMPSSTGDGTPGKKQLNRGFAFVQFSSHAAAARAYRIGSSPDFMLAGNWHPAIDWAEKEPELDPDELAKIKVAFVGNLPADADDEYLKELFMPFGKLEKVALSRKSHFPVGFVHFADRSDLDKAIKEMDGKTVPGPHRGPNFKIQVSVARPMEKDRKRGRDEAISKPPSKLGTRRDSSSGTRGHGSSTDHKSKVPRHTELESDVADPYEAAVITLPSTVKERLLRVLRLGIANRYDIDMQSIASLKELPESSAIAVLDQLILSGADRRNKGEYFTSLITKHQVYKSGLGWRSNFPTKPNDFLSESERLHTPVSVHTQANYSHASQPAGGNVARYSRYSISPDSLPYLPNSDDVPSRGGTGKVVELAPAYRTTSLGYASGTRLVSHISPASDHAPERSQIKFDPFTGQPFKFDPFTGELIRPEATSRYSAGHL
uniref:APOBEC1 complementation factor n=1 Tax=Anthurium amnicola TaxID=1678845 RepID=A0A1D1ZF27_9ARAE